MLKGDAGKFEEKVTEGYCLRYASPKKRMFNVYSRCVEEYYHFDCQTYITLTVGKGPDQTFDYEGLFDSFTPLVEVKNEDLVRSYLENELFNSPCTSSVQSSTSVPVQPDILEELYDSSDDTDYKDLTSKPFIEHQ